jgi:nicotinamide-nucleotide amidase
MQSEIISIGNELLNGSTVNSNAAFIAQQLYEIGYSTENIQTIRDSSQAIETALTLSLGRAEIIIITGGLGPTHDDITVNVLSNYFSSKLIFKEDIFNKIQERFQKRGIRMPETNRSMAMVPQDAQLIENKLGTAPGLIFQSSHKLIFVLPGVPEEMKAMMEESVLPRLQQEYPECQIKVDLFRTTGIPESLVYEKIAKELESYPSYEIAFLPKVTGVDIRIVRKGDEIQNLEKFEKFKNILYNAVGDFIYASEGHPLEAVLGNIIKSKKLTISVAESLTGGLVQDKLTDIPGSSEYFIGGIIAYSNEAKIKLLSVSKNTLRKYGAVSEQVAQEMAEGVKEIFGTQIGISTTGIAGPGGATPEKPVGLVYIGISMELENLVRKFQFTGNREINKHRSAQAALELLRRALLNITC